MIGFLIDGTNRVSKRYFDVIPIRAEDSIRDETLGTKNKFWVEIDGKSWLFKEARFNTGEDWSEKIAAEIAKLISIPAATIELAECGGQRGTVSLSFINREKGEDLIHGNEIMAGQVLGYNPNKRFGQSDHTLENIRKAICKLHLDSDRSDEFLKQLASYMVLDGLIGNVDRHHENWGLVEYAGAKDQDRRFNVYVAPTFDHASCLGRELLDEKIRRILTSPNGVWNYISNGRGAIYLSASSPHGENPLKLVEFGSRRFPKYFSEAINSVKSVNLIEILASVDRIPESRISQCANQFVKKFLLMGRKV